MALDLHGKTIAVTGATGFLGSHLALELAARGAQVRGVVRSPEKGAWLESGGIELARADLRDKDALCRAFEGADAVVANAALAVGWARAPASAYHEANVVGAQNTLEAARDAAIRRVVKVSTVAVYRTRLGRPMREDHPKVDQGFDWSHVVTNRHYARTKAAAERHAWDFAARHDIALTVLRPGPIYGPRDPKMTARFAAAMQRRLAVVPTLRLPMVHAGDVAVAVGGALANPDSAGRAYNVTGEPVGLHELHRTWRRLVGRGPVIVPVPVPVRVAYDNRAAADDLGFRPRSLEDGLRDAIGGG